MDILKVSKLPSVSLVRGCVLPEVRDSLVAALCGKFSIRPLDVMYVASLTMEAAGAVTEFASWAPLGLSKLVVIPMEKATLRAQNSLLTLLEEPPDCVKFIIFADYNTIPTIVSRSQIFQLNTGHPVSKQGKALVLSVLKTVSSGQAGLVEDLFKNWDEDASSLLMVWSVEYLLHKPKVFTSEELEIPFPRSFASNLIQALASSGSARGRFAVKYIMLSYLEMNRGVR